MAEADKKRVWLFDENRVDHGNEEFLATIAMGKTAVAASKEQAQDDFPEVDLDRIDELGLWN